MITHKKVRLCRKNVLFYFIFYFANRQALLHIWRRFLPIYHKCARFFIPFPPFAAARVGRQMHSARRAADRRQRVTNMSARGEFVYQKRHGKQRTDSGQWVRTAVSRIQFPQKRFPRRKLSFAAAACRGCKKRSAKAFPSTEKDRKNGHLNNKEVQKRPPQRQGERKSAPLKTKANTYLPLTREFLKLRIILRNILYRLLHKPKYFQKALQVPTNEWENTSSRLFSLLYPNFFL